MGLWLLLILTSLFSYFLVQRSVARITRTPAWILWLALSMPIFIVIISGFTSGTLKAILSFLAIAAFFISPVLYWRLIQLGRTDTQPADKATAPATAEQESKLRPIDQTEETNLRNCFPWSIYYLENIEYRPQAVLCRGKLRSNPELAYKTIWENISQQFGDRFFLIFQEGLNGKPFFALVPNPQAAKTAPPEREPLIKPFFALALLAFTFCTTTFFGGNALFAEQIGKVTTLGQLFNPAILKQGLFYSLAVMAILGIHELGHYFLAVFYKIRATLPYFIPIPFFPGTFGAFMQMRSPVPHRKALFDMAIAGPVAGLILTFPILIWGLSLSTVVPLAENSHFLNFKALDPRFSLLLALLSKLALGSALTAKTAIHLHPLAVAGYMGLLFAAFNLMPVGQLDGGHIVHAMFGQRTAAAIGQIARLLMLGISLFQPDLLLWAILLFFLPTIDEPALNDVSELDNWRDLSGLLALTLLIAIVLPIPERLTQLLSF